MKLKAIFLGLTISLIGGSAFATKLGEKYVQHINGETIKSVTIEKIAVERASGRRGGYMDYASNCTSLKKNGDGFLTLPSTGDVQIDAILQIGAKIFTLIKENAPQITVASVASNALPLGISCWDQLEGWKLPRAEVYRVTYQNLFGVNVVDFQFRLIYSYGGNVNGAGRYLANSTIQYKKLDVKVGYIFDASVEIPQVLNMGTQNAPVAGMQINLNWSVTTRPIAFKKELNTASFFIFGDGRKTVLY